MTETIELVPIDDIRPDPKQPRKLKSPDQITGLAQNFKQKGVGMINPIEVDDKGIIVTGEMRWLAAKEAGFAQVPTRRYTPETPELRFLRQMSENVHQTSVGLFRMSPLDTAHALQRLCDMEVKGLLGPLPGDADLPSKILGRKWGGHVPSKGPTRYRGIAPLATRLGISDASIAQYLDLLDSTRVPEVLRKAVKEGKVNVSVAHQVREVPREFREALANRVATESKHGRVDSFGLRAVGKALRQQPDKATEIIETVQANTPRGQIEKALRDIAPTLSEAVDDAVAPGQKLEKAVEGAIFAIREVGNAATLPAGQEAAYGAVLRLRDTCDEFLAGSDPQLAPVDAKVIS